jgi:recombination protein RecR
MPKSIQELTELIAELPGLGPRQARRVVQYLLRANPGYKAKLVAGISSLSSNVSQCEKCFRFDEINTEKFCPVCADKNRETKTCMVVEKDVDAEGVEVAGVYRGQYFILGSLIPLAATRKSRIAPRINELIQRLRNDVALGVQEVILAFATTPEGDFTAREVKDKISSFIPEIKVTILGRGLSLGAEIEYADGETLRSALQGRREEF